MAAASKEGLEVVGAPETLAIKTPAGASGDALGWLELPGPSSPVASAQGMKGWGVAQPVSRLPLLVEVVTP